jgi:hypothetical protein
LKHSQDVKLSIPVHVDDSIFSDNGLAEKGNVLLEVEIKDLGKLRYFLVIEVGYSEKVFSFLKVNYVLYLLEETGKLGWKASHETKSRD